MAASITVYPAAIESIIKGDLELDAGTIKVLLLDSGSFNNAHDFVNDISAGEHVHASYSRQTIANKTVSRSGSTVTFDGDDVTFINLAGSNIVAAAIFKDGGGSDSGNPLVAFINFGLTFTPNGNNFQLAWNSSGIFTATIS